MRDGILHVEDWRAQVQGPPVQVAHILLLGGSMLPAMQMEDNAFRLRNHLARAGLPARKAGGERRKKAKGGWRGREREDLDRYPVRHSKQEHLPIISGLLKGEISVTLIPFPFSRWLEGIGTWKAAPGR